MTGPLLKVFVDNFLYFRHVTSAHRNSNRLNTWHSFFSDYNARYSFEVGSHLYESVLSESCHTWKNHVFIRGIFAKNNVKSFLRFLM